MKYQIGKDLAIDQIFGDDMIQSIRDEKTEETIRMHAIYYDTTEDVLSKHGIGMRIRKENDYYVGTLKWGGGSEDGMHRRQEVNVPVRDSRALTTATLDVFQPCGEIYDEICNILQGQKLTQRVVMTFSRRQIRLDNGKMICVLSTDEGIIQAGPEEAPVRELELELLNGEEEQMIAIGDHLRETYGLVPENKTKLERGFSLLNGSRSED